MAASCEGDQAGVIEWSISFRYSTLIYWMVSLRLGIPRATTRTLAPLLASNLATLRPMP